MKYMRSPVKCYTMKMLCNFTANLHNAFINITIPLEGFRIGHLSYGLHLKSAFTTQILVFTSFVAPHRVPQVSH